MNDRTYTVVELGGHWPNWFGKIGMRFICVYIRYGSASIGIGGSHADALDHCTVVSNGEQFCGVTEIEDAVKVLQQNDYRVHSIVIPEHVEELSHG